MSSPFVDHELLGYALIGLIIESDYASVTSSLDNTRCGPVDHHMVATGALVLCNENLCCVLLVGCPHTLFPSPLNLVGIDDHHALMLGLVLEGPEHLKFFSWHVDEGEVLNS